ncbi:unnamed protein product [Protopolystoma xenopodis]|uniref:Uncharacterized protein n=1 Tax=Protopolystoma xenopodis TaxID=117903 RepID=A0A448WVQ1_9PLAT|nr:unnamed protein product [Protopolystoma xenopodis]
MGGLTPRMQVGQKAVTADIPRTTPRPRCKNPGQRVNCPSRRAESARPIAALESAQTVPAHQTSLVLEENGQDAKCAQLNGSASCLKLSIPQLQHQPLGFATYSRRQEDIVEFTDCQSCHDIFHFANIPPSGAVSDSYNLSK